MERLNLPSDEFLRQFDLRDLNRKNDRARKGLVAAGDERASYFSYDGRRLSESRAHARAYERVRCVERARVRSRASFFRNRRRVGGAKLEDAEEGRRPVINGTRETAFLEPLLVLLFAARRPQRDERAERARESHPSFEREPVNQPSSSSSRHRQLPISGATEGPAAGRRGFFEQSAFSRAEMIDTRSRRVDE